MTQGRRQGSAQLFRVRGKWIWLPLLLEHSSLKAELSLLRPFLPLLSLKKNVCLTKPERTLPKAFLMSQGCKFQDRNMSKGRGVNHDLNAQRITKHLSEKTRRKAGKLNRTVCYVPKWLLISKNNGSRCQGKRNSTTCSHVTLGELSPLLTSPSVGNLLSVHRSPRVQFPTSTLSKPCRILASGILVSSLWGKVIVEVFTFDILL